MKRASVAIMIILGMASAAFAAEPIRVLRGFEWEEYAGKLPRWHYIGKPHLDEPGPGWKGEPIAKLDDVGPDGFQVIDATPSASRQYPRELMVRAHATQGQFAWKCTWPASRWAWAVAQLKEKFPGPWPVHETGYDPQDYLFQRELQLWRQGSEPPADWSGFDRLRFDVTAVGAPVRLGFRVRDASGPKLPPGPTGLRTALAAFDIPADQTVTCDVPLASLARAGELDLDATLASTL